MVRELGTCYPPGSPLHTLSWRFIELHAKMPGNQALFSDELWHQSCEALRMPHSVLVDQAAALLGLSRRTIYYRIRQGKLVTLRTRCGSQRVLMSSLERLLREMGHEPGGAGQKGPDAPSDLTIGQDVGV